jgi:hypothetical protein
MRKISGLLILFFFASMTNAEIYKWTDEQGQIHFGDKPANKSAKQIQLRKQNISTTPNVKQQNLEIPTTDAQRRANQARFGDSLEADRVKRERQEAKKKKNKAQREKNCRYAQRNLQIANEVGSVFFYDEQGNRVYYNKQQRQAYHQRRQAQVDKWCN